jgi:hypothetical protein
MGGSPPCGNELVGKGSPELTGPTYRIGAAAGLMQRRRPFASLEERGRREMLARRQVIPTGGANR